MFESILLVEDEAALRATLGDRLDRSAMDSCSRRGAVGGVHRRRRFDLGRAGAGRRSGPDRRPLARPVPCHIAARPRQYSRRRALRGAANRGRNQRHGHDAHTDARRGSADTIHFKRGRPAAHAHHRFAGIAPRLGRGAGRSPATGSSETCRCRVHRSPSELNRSSAILRR